MSDFLGYLEKIRNKIIIIVYCLSFRDVFGIFGECEYWFEEGLVYIWKI